MLLLKVKSEMSQYDPKYLCNMLVEMVLGERICRAQPTKLLASYNFSNRFSLSVSVRVFEST